MSFVDPAKLVAGDQQKIAAAVEGLLHSDKFLSAILSGTNGKGAIIVRTSAAKDAIGDAVPHAVFG